MNRRKFLKRAFLGGLGVAGLGAVDTFAIEPWWIEVKHVDFAVRDLAAAFDGFRVVLIADTHCGKVVEPDFVRKAVRLANEQEPDVTLLLGDYRNRSDAATAIVPFGDLQAKHGVFAVMGNHDHWEGIGPTRRELERAGATVLANRGVVLERDGGRLAVGGVDDLWEGFPEAAAALDAVPADVPRLLMSHNPDYAEKMGSGVRVDVMLSGHTHGGQVYIPLVGAPRVPSSYGQKYRAGLAEGPWCPVYVTRGVGMIGGAIRFCCRPELTVLTLRKE